jgi:hypothetical protein
MSVNETYGAAEQDWSFIIFSGTLKTRFNELPLIINKHIQQQIHLIKYNS